MSNGNGHRWSKFWWRDHQGDAALRACSLAARGYWMEVLCIAHEAERVGHVLINGKKPTGRQMAIIAGCTEREARKLEAELEDAGVFSRTDDGTIYSRRMVKDAEAAETARAWGKAGGNPNLKPKPNGASHGPPEPGGVNPPVKVEGYPPPNPTPLTPPLTEEVNGGVIPRGRVRKETEEEKKVSVFNNLPSSSAVLARVAAACETPPVGTFGAEPEQETDAPDENPVSNALQIATQNLVGKLARKLESSGKTPIGKRPQLTVIEQQDYVLHGEVIEADRPAGWVPQRPGPRDPLRTREQQYAELLGISLAEANAALGHPQTLEHAL